MENTAGNADTECQPEVAMMGDQKMDRPINLENKKGSEENASDLSLNRNVSTKIQYNKAVFQSSCDFKD